MWSSSNKSKPMPSHQNPLCTRTHQIGALLLVVVTFFFTRLFDHSFLPCNLSGDQLRPSQKEFLDGSQWWPEQLSVKMYVYDPEEIDGLKELMYGRDGRITEDACLKGQWVEQELTCSNLGQHILIVPLFSYQRGIGLIREIQVPLIHGKI
ncbi:unnamed protein product [Lupinus luteus]|uniref:Uncharacterized protein n=1 Tax=Lupinus luteus TaxID=3873 RepID=A0AAV1VVW7_LUPLU